MILLSLARSALLSSFISTPLRHAFRASRHLQNTARRLAEEEPRPAFVHEGAARLEISGEAHFQPGDSFIRDLKVLVSETFSKQYIKCKNYPVNKWFLYPKEDREDCPPDMDIEAPIRVLECCTGTGASGIRLTKELTRSVQSILCDERSAAVQLAERNVAKNGCGHAKVKKGHFAETLFQYRDPDLVFDLVDVDLPDHPLRFASSVLDGIAIGGLVLFRVPKNARSPSWSSDVSEGTYHGFGLLERKLRVLLGSWHEVAVIHGLAVEPLLTTIVQGDIFGALKLIKFKAEVHNPLDFVKAVAFCPVCRTREFQAYAALGNRCRSPVPAAAHCSVCRGDLHLAGELWCGPLTNKKFLSEMLTVLKQPGGVSKWFSNGDRLLNLLSALEQEQDDTLWFDLADMAASVGCPPISRSVFIAALKTAGFNASETHLSVHGLRTDAPARIVWDLLCFWMRKSGLTVDSCTTDLGRMTISREPALEDTVISKADEVLCTVSSR